MKRVAVIGGGAAGLMAAYAAAEEGAEVVLFEQNEKLGKKIYITGKGRGNFTNDCLPEEFLTHVVHGERFLHGAIRAFTPQDTMAFFESYGMPYKVERGNRAFPVSDHASDITKAFTRALQEKGAKVRLHSAVREIAPEAGEWTVRGEDFCEKFAAVVLCTGGISYPATGSTGDGYRFAKGLGHAIVPPVPSLTGLNTKEDFTSVQGIALKNCVLTARRGGTVLFSQMGELLFTHFGISGPLVLSLSALVNRLPLAEVSLTLDLKPALSEAMLEKRILSDFAERKNENIGSVARGYCPRSVALLLLRHAGISPQKQVNSVTKGERAAFLNALKSFPISVRALRGFEEAIVTSGGVATGEVNPKTMESKVQKGLYFAGEVLDLDAFTGGFNLQIAFSTGHLAGKSAAKGE